MKIKYIGTYGNEVNPNSHSVKFDFENLTVAKKTMKRKVSECCNNGKFLHWIIFRAESKNKIVDSGFTYNYK